MSTTPTHNLHPRKRLRQFIDANGRKIHVAHSPEEAADLHRRLSSIKPGEPFDVHIHGSPEHLEALRETHSHHEERRRALREQHANLYDEFETVREELDSLSHELLHITDHDIALDANFSKYGYSAHLRTKNDYRDSPGTATPSADGGSEKHDWDAERHNGRTVVFFKKPVVRQYFHKGLLWRASNTEEVASFELFVDLLYVGLIAITGDTASEHPSGSSLLRFAVSFILSWKIWTDLTLIISWFETDDILQRICVLFVMTCLFGYTTNIVEAEHKTYPQMIAFYLAARLFSAAYFVFLAIIIPMMRAVILGNAIIAIIPSALWIASIYVEEPSRYALIWIAIVLDLFGPMVMLIFTRWGTFWQNKFGGRISRAFEFYPAINIEHKTERMNAFVTLVFGYSVVNILYQNTASVGINAFFGKAVLGLVQAFAFNWLYFEIDGDDLFQHAIRRHVKTALAWNVIHLPFIMGYVLAAATLSRLVVAHDCAGADLKNLTKFYVAKSEEELSDALRWFYCAGLGIALASMGIISLTHVHKDIRGARLRKRHRLAVRFAVSIVLLCLPTAHSLNSLELIATTTSLVLLVLTVDLYGASCVGTSVFGRRTTCRYEAECSLKRKELENAIRTGEKIEVEKIAERMGGEKGYDLS
ncbi:MAG: hypothetical protein M1832_003878 [Thelocarpon impressellum]|nr:MAG: hypothetical protein M1832_003878 [Thelocarpon impressellum]